MKCVKVALVGFFCTLGVAWADPTVGQLKSTLTDKKKLESALQSGQRQAAFCFSCHGEHGISLQPEVPNLAGQPAAYLLEQIRRFGDGRRRDPFMQGLLKAMSDGEKLNIALYFSAQKLGPTDAGTGNPEAGRAIYKQRCENCHGANGRGNDMMPTVASQKVTYLAKSLTRYRDRSGERQHKEMSDSLAKVSDAEIAHLAAFMTALK